MEDQVANDNKLLEEMIGGLANCDELYRPTNYWAHYQQSFVPELKFLGLQNFRSRKNSVLYSFGATDYLAEARIKLRHSFRGAGRIARILNYLIEETRIFQLQVSGIVPLEIVFYFYFYVKKKFEELGLDLGQCATTRIGHPEDIQEIEGGLWTTAHLQYCSLFADAAKCIPFRQASVVCELGTGLGRNVEIMARLFKDATFLIFDIPPQLYVCHQYLQALFGDRVVPYREAIKFSPPTHPPFSLPSDIKGKIIILPSWCMPDWSKTKIDVFWNSASFQEMEPDVVVNYLRLVMGMSPEWIHINALPQGNYWGEWKPGRGGTKKPVLEKYYLETLGDIYPLHKIYDTDNFLRKKSYKSYIFKKSAPPA